MNMERLQDFARSASDWFWETDDKFQFTLFSGRLDNIFDKLASHLIGKTRWELCHGDIENDPLWRAHYEDHVAERPFRDFQYILPLPDGSEISLLVSGVPFFDPGGRFLGFRGTARNETDVTAIRNRAQKAESLLDLAIRSMNDAFAIFDAKDNLAHFNKAYENIMDSLGCRLELGMSFKELCLLSAENAHSWSDEAAKADWLQWRIKRHQMCEGFEEKMVRDGRWFRGDEKRLPTGETVVVIKDISSLKHAQTTLEEANSELELQVSKRTTALQKKNKLLKDQIKKRTEAEQEYQNIFENTPVGIYRSSPEGRFLRANPALVALSGYETEAQMIDSIQDIGTDWYVNASDREQFYVDMGEYGRITDQRTVIKNRKTGMKVAISESALAIHKPNGDIAYYEGTVQNITGQLEVQSNLELMTQEAVTANKAKSSFLAHMSHELRTPLNAILGFSETMTLGIFGKLGSERYEGYVSNINTSAAHLLCLINDILDLAKIEDGRTELHEEIISIKELFEATAQFIKPDIKAKNIDLKLVVPEEFPDLYCDERKIKQAMINLVSNAVKFTPENGNVTVTATCRASQMISLSVADTGPGIPENELSRIVEPFARARAARENAIPGSGLGLALVKALAEEHDGTFTLSSILGMGTTTRVTFPAYRVRHRKAYRIDPLIVNL